MIIQCESSCSIFTHYIKRGYKLVHRGIPREAILWVTWYVNLSNEPLPEGNDCFNGVCYTLLHNTKIPTKLNVYEKAPPVLQCNTTPSGFMIKHFSNTNTNSKQTSLYSLLILFSISWLVQHHPTNASLGNPCGLFWNLYYS